MTDALLLRKIILFLADNIGNNTSAASIGRTLVNEGLLDNGRKSKPAVQTISAYINALLESYIFYEVKRFDIKGKDYLRTLGKYYIVDPGLRTYLLGNRAATWGTSWKTSSTWSCCGGAMKSPSVKSGTKRSTSSPLK